MNDDKSIRSRFQRALTQGVKNTETHAESRSAGAAHGGETAGGWDPWEVWLRRIEQPRRRAEQEPKSATD